jgi:bifunctional enzyme CysN/CysC
VSQLKIVVCGHVDHGKSTVIGKLLTETGFFPLDRVEKIKRLCNTQQKKFEYAFLLDALEEEQTQGITIDMTEVRWRYQNQPVLFIDTPGHIEFLKNMIGGATHADGALLIADVNDDLYFQKHASLISTLGIKNIVVAVNKMDTVNYSEASFLEFKKKTLASFKQGLIDVVQVLPLSAFHGENLLKPSEKMRWHTGPTLAEALIHLPVTESLDREALRLPIQDVYKFDDKRIYVGRIEAGKVAVADEVVFYPSGVTAHIKSLEVLNEPEKTSAQFPESIGFTIDKPVFLDRSEIMTRSSDRAPHVLTRFKADIFWLATNDLRVGDDLELLIATSKRKAKVIKIISALQPQSLASGPADRLISKQMGQVELQVDHPLAFDLFSEITPLSRFVLIQDERISGGGKVTATATQNLKGSESQVPQQKRIERFGHKGFVVWMTGLSGAGKSTLARKVEAQLFQQGYNVFVLDGDNVRQGLSQDLGFSLEDRSENLRRVAEVAKLFAEAGMICITAFVSPLQEDRERARAIIGPDRFLEVFVECPFSECEKRDPKSLYKKMRQGEVKDFTGVDSPYEAPREPHLTLPTAQLDSERCAELLQENILNFI